MSGVVSDLLLIESLNLSSLTNSYHKFFLSLLPSTFILAALFEYFDRLEPFLLLKRALISILILTTIVGIYHVSIKYSMDAADVMLGKSKESNILLMDMLSGNKRRSDMNYDKGKNANFFKDKNYFAGTLQFLKYHMFKTYVNDGFTISVYFISKLCLGILRIIYSLVYYLGIGLIGIPCLLYLFPSMGNVLRGGIIGYLWCLITPHVLVFILTLIGSEINRGYLKGEIIGASMTGTALLFLMTVFIAFVPLVSMMILAGSGVSAAGGIIASMGANYVFRQGLNSSMKLLMGGPQGGLVGKALGGALKTGSVMLGSGSNAFSSFRGGGKNSLGPKSGLQSEAPVYRGPNAQQISHHMQNLSKDLNIPMSYKGAEQTTAPKFKLNTSQHHQGSNNGTIQKHSGQYRKTENSLHANRSHRSSKQSNNSRARDIREPKRRK